MIKVRLRTRARADLASIWQYSATNWSAEQADAYVAQINSQFLRISEFPEHYPVHQSRHGVFRKAASGEHFIFYLIETDMIDVVRVLHKRMNFDERLA